VTLAGKTDFRLAGGNSHLVGSFVISPYIGRIRTAVPLTMVTAKNKQTSTPSAIER
jgi:hypothetical protein